MKNINIAAIASVMVLYFGLCAGLWHYAYWSMFDINYLQYIDVSDVIKDFSIPFLKSVGTFSTSTIALILFVYRWWGTSDFSQIRLHIMINRFFNKSYMWIITVIVIFFLYGIISKPSIEYHLLASNMASYYIAIVVAASNIGIKYVLNIGMRVFLSLYFFSLPFLSYFAAEKKSHNVYHNLDYDLCTSHENRADTIPQAINNIPTLKYLGSSNDFIFLISSDNQEVTLLPISEIDVFKYKRVHYYTPSFESR